MSQKPDEVIGRDLDVKLIGRLKIQDSTWFITKEFEDELNSLWSCCTIKIKFIGTNRIEIKNS